MGMSLIANLYYGFPLAETDGEDEAHDEGKEDYVAEEEWVTFEAASRFVYKPEHQDYKSDDWKAYFTQRRQIIEALPCDILRLGHTEYGYYALAIRGTIFAKYSRDDNAIVVPAVDPLWDGQLREWCEKHGFTYSVPSWQLAPYYG